MIELTKEDFDRLVKDIKRASEDDMIGSFSHIDFKDYASHSNVIEKAVAEMGLTDKVKITYESFGISVDIL